MRKVKKNPKISAPKLADEYYSETGRQVSSCTIRRCLKRNDLHGRRARKKSYISNANKKKRLEFAKENINNPPDFWNRVIFTDESKLELFCTRGNQKVWRRKNDAMNVKNLILTVKYGGKSVMVWWCVSAGGVGFLEFIDGIMDHVKYINILRRNLHSSARKLGIGQNFIFLQDNDP